MFCPKKELRRPVKIIILRRRKTNAHLQVLIAVFDILIYKNRNMQVIFMTKQKKVRLDIEKDIY